MMDKNKRLRERFILVAEENGLKFSWISKKLNISNSTMSHWRQGNFDMGKEKLNTIEKFLNGYEI